MVFGPGHKSVGQIVIIGEVVDFVQGPVTQFGFDLGLVLAVEVFDLDVRHTRYFSNRKDRAKVNKEI